MLKGIIFLALPIGLSPRCPGRPGRSVVDGHGKQPDEMSETISQPTYLHGVKIHWKFIESCIFPKGCFVFTPFLGRKFPTFNCLSLDTFSHPEGRLRLSGFGTLMMSTVAVTMDVL